MKKLDGTSLCAALVLLFAFAQPAGASAHETISAPHPQEISQTPAMKRARAFTDWMTVRSDQAHRWLRRARSRGQAPLARCINDKLSQLHAIERMGQADAQAIAAAVRVGGLTGGHMVRLVHLGDASMARLAEAARCGQPHTATPTLAPSNSVSFYAPPLHDMPEL